MSSLAGALGETAYHRRNHDADHASNASQSEDDEDMGDLFGNDDDVEEFHAEKSVHLTRIPLHFLISKSLCQEPGFPYSIWTWFGAVDFSGKRTQGGAGIWGTRECAGPGYDGRSEGS